MPKVDGSNAELSGSQISPLPEEESESCESQNNKLDNFRPDSPSARYTYLSKRRLFVIDRLASRYAELLKLLNEELVSPASLFVFVVAL